MPEIAALVEAVGRVIAIDRARARQGEGRVGQGLLADLVRRRVGEGIFVGARAARIQLEVVQPADRIIAVSRAAAVGPRQRLPPAHIVIDEMDQVGRDAEGADTGSQRRRLHHIGGVSKLPPQFQ